MTSRAELALARKGIKQKDLTTERSKGVILSCRVPPKGLAEGNPPDLFWLFWDPPLRARRRQPPGSALALLRSPTTNLPCRLAPSLNPATGGILNARPPQGSPQAIPRI